MTDFSNGSSSSCFSLYSSGISTWGLEGVFSIGLVPDEEGALLWKINSSVISLRVANSHMKTLHVMVPRPPYMIMYLCVYAGKIHVRTPALC